jgi:hypothetical protein
MDFDAFYERIDGETFRATHATSSPWDVRLQHGGPPTALIARIVRDVHPRDDMRIARIASEFLGPIPVGAMRVKTRVVRPGKRIELVEGTLECDGRDVVSARLWRIAVQVEGSVPRGVTPPDPVPALPPADARQHWITTSGYGQAIEWREVHGGAVLGPAAIWGRPRVPLIAGEAHEPVDSALIIADSANGISGELPMGEWLFVPPSLSLALQRYPRGEWVLLDARTELTGDGLGMTSLRLADAGGWFGIGNQALLVERRA